MRVNKPVTNVERHLKEGEYIVSKTDAQGRITYVNRPFTEMSGFSEEELLGAPHNIVRHPDMPPAAFEDLWQTLQSGKPWRGMVKNRCKNGDYYWVDANANPIWENDRIVGYMSLRVRPSRAQVEQAEEVYRLFREGEARGLTVKEGRVVRTGLRGRLEAFAKGFAVVASEVRKLAERSQLAAHEIGELALNSSATAEKTGKLLDEMVPSINKTSDLVQEIAVASEEQAAGVAQVDTAMAQMNKITQHNASSSEELAATAEEVSSHAEHLQRLMAFFNAGQSGVGSDKRSVTRHEAVGRRPQYGKHYLQEGVAQA